MNIVKIYFLQPSSQSLEADQTHPGAAKSHKAPLLFSMLLNFASSSEIKLFDFWISLKDLRSLHK